MNQVPGSYDVLMSSGLFPQGSSAMAFGAASAGKTLPEVVALQSGAQMTFGGPTMHLEKQLAPLMRQKGVVLQPLTLVGERF
jgi:hypothetical protein